jgi:hypothetical protein
VNAICAITGQPIRRGYPVSQMVTSATAEFLDCFRGNLHGWVSESAARCFKSANPRIGNPCARPLVIFEDGAAYMPTIARDSLATLPACLVQAGVDIERPCWSDLVRQLWPQRAGQRCVIILSTDTKKRLWIRARVGALGPRTPVLVYDAPTAQNAVVLLDWPALIECLGLIEEVYTIGFAKAAIRDSLYRANKVVQTIGIGETRRYERALTQCRGRAEFGPALLIAQKAPEPELVADKEEMEWRRQALLPQFA